jgi:hypothetical protein
VKFPEESVVVLAAAAPDRDTATFASAGDTFPDKLHVWGVSGAAEEGEPTKLAPVLPQATAKIKETAIEQTDSVRPKQLPIAPRPC